MTKRWGSKGVATALLAVTLATVGGQGAAHAGEFRLRDAVGAPKNLKLSGSIRARAEALDGQFRTTGPADDSFYSFRTTLFAEYDTGPVRIGAELLDARGYGQKRNSTVGNSEVNALELLQGYVALDLGGDVAGGGKGAITAGRFTIDIGSQRLVARQSFPNALTGFTGINLDWRSAEGHRLIALWAMPQQRLPNDAASIRDNEVEWDLETTDLQLYGASYTRDDLFAGASAELYAYGLDERDSATRPTRNRHLYTPGVRLFRAPGKGAFDFDIEAAYQFGETRATSAATDLQDLDVAAGFAHAEVGKRYDARWSPRVSVHFDYASGDDPRSSSYNRFDALFGSRRADFGPSGLYGPIARANLLSGGLRGEIKPSGRLDASVTYRALWLAEDRDSFGSSGVRDRTGASGRFAGSQVEGRVRYWLVPKQLRWEGGGAYLAKGEFLEDAPAARATGDSVYVHMDLTAEF